MAYFMEGRLQDSIDILLRSMVADPGLSGPGGDRSEFSNLFLIAAYDRIGNRERARKLYQDYVQHWPHRSVWRMASYFSKAQVQLPTFKELHDGLIDAGMPEFTMPPDQSAIPDSPTKYGDFEVAPVRISGASSLTVKELAAALERSPAPVVLDVWRGAATIEGSYWMPDPDSTTDGLEAWLTRQPKGRTIIVVDNGFYGTIGYSVVRRVLRAGHWPVEWLVGGEEALAAAGFPTVDRRVP